MLLERTSVDSHFTLIFIAVLTENASLVLWPPKDVAFLLVRFEVKIHPPLYGRAPTKEIVECVNAYIDLERLKEGINHPMEANKDHWEGQK